MANDRYINQLYSNYEEAQNKLDQVLNELNLIRKEHKIELKNLKKSLTSEFKKEKDELKDTINNLNKELKKVTEQNEKLIKENEKLKNQINKNSSNSSKPSSTNITTPKKKTGANLYNYRTKSNKKVGGQLGHQGHNLGKEKIEKLILTNKIEVREFEHFIKGNSNKPDTVKYKLGIEIKPYVEKHIFKYCNDVNEKLPKEFYTDVTYNNSIKALAIELGTYNVVSYDRLSDFFSVITNGVINISNSNLVNIMYEFSNKSKPTLTNLEINILNSKTVFTDETGTKYNGKNMYVRNYSNNETVLYKSHKNKGHEPIKNDDILTKFCGGIMGDHDTTLSSYGNKNYECNIHFGRYLEELIQNIPNVLWPIKMKELLFRINNTRKIAIAFGLKKFDNEKIKEYTNQFDEIIMLAKTENQSIVSSYYKEKANKLYRRIIKYKKNHLYFMVDFDVPFDNNMSEQDLRIFKIKTKISGGFRSLYAASHYVNTLSIIKSSIKRNINPFDSIQNIFNNQILFT